MTDFQHISTVKFSDFSHFVTNPLKYRSAFISTAIMANNSRSAVRVPRPVEEEEKLALTLSAVHIDSDSSSDEGFHDQEAKHTDQPAKEAEDRENRVEDAEGQDKETETVEGQEQVGKGADEELDKAKEGMVANQDEHDEDLVERGPMPVNPPQSRQRYRSQPYAQPTTEAIDIPWNATILSRVVARNLLSGTTMTVNENVPDAKSFSPDNPSSLNGHNCKSRSNLHKNGGGVIEVAAPAAVVPCVWQHEQLQTWPVGDSSGLLNPLQLSPVLPNVFQTGVPLSTIQNLGDRDRDVVESDDSLTITNNRSTVSPTTTWCTRRNPSPFSPSGSSDYSSEPPTPSPSYCSVEVMELLLDYNVEDQVAPMCPVEELVMMLAAPPLADKSKLAQLLPANACTEICGKLKALPAEAFLKQDYQGDTQLHIAVANQDLKYVSAIVQRMNILSIPLDTRNHSRQTALSIAISLKYPEIVEFLLIYGADLTKVDVLDHYGGNVLHFIASNGERYLDVAREICQFKIDFTVNACDDHGNTPLCRAVSWHRNEVNSIPFIELLLKNGAKITMNSNTFTSPLHMAADRCSYALTEVLCRLTSNIKTEINRPGPMGRTALSLVSSLANANREEQEKVIRVLMQYGAYPARRITPPSPVSNT